MHAQRRLLIASILIALSQSTVAQTVVIDKINSDKANMEHMSGERESRLYYKMGGARPVSEPPSQSAEIKLGGSAVIGPGYSCGQFDPINGLQNFFNNLERGLDNAVNTVQNAATSAIASLPMMLIQRNSPGLYEMLQNNIFRAEEQWRFSAMSCQEMERRIAQGQNPYKKYLEFAQGETLQEEAMSNPDATTAMKNVETGGGDNGFYMPVPDKGIIKVGGLNQDPIKPLTYTAVVGYNLIIGTEITNITEPHSILSQYESQGALIEHFPDPLSLAEWLVMVLGEEEIYTTDSPKSEPETKSALGLMVSSYRASDRIKSILNKVRQAVNREEKVKILRESSEHSALDVTPELLSQVEGFGVGVEGMFLHNLAGELAIKSTIEKAELARRALIIGLSEPNIANIGPVQDEVWRKLSVLQREMEQLVFEYRIKKELVNDLANIAYEEDIEDIKQNIQEKRAQMPQLKNTEAPL